MNPLSLSRPTSRKQKALLIATAFVAVVGSLVVFSLPPKRVALSTSTPGSATTAAGVFHVHTSRSDGTGTPDEIAAAAAHAGLQFVIFTDHGNGTRAPDRPQYRHGVLCLDAVEISTAEGHY